MKPFLSRLFFAVACWSLRWSQRLDPIFGDPLWTEEDEQEAHYEFWRESR